MKRYKWLQIPYFIQTKAGRKRLRSSILYRMRTVIIPLAHIYRKTIIRHVKIIAVIGSFGKTTTTRAVAAALGDSPEKHQGINNGVHLAAGLLSIPPWARYRVLEVGISKKGQMAVNAKLIRPDIVAVTCIGSEHGSSLGDLNQTREEKAAMLKALTEDSFAVFNGDDPHVQRMRRYVKSRVFTHGYNAENDLQASLIKTDLEKGTLFSIKSGDQQYQLATKLYGRASVRSMMAALIIARELGIDVNLALKRLSKLSPVQQRLEITSTSSGIYLLDDSLKSAIETIELALDTLETLPAARKILILGEVEEPPESLGKIYRAIGARAARIATHLIFIGSKRVKRPLFAEARRSGMSDENLLFAEHSMNRAQELAQQLVKPGDLVLIKGRSSQKLERIACVLKGEKVSCSLEFCGQKTRCTDCINLGKGPTSSIDQSIDVGQSKNSLFRNKKRYSEADGGWLT